MVEELELYKSFHGTSIKSADSICKENCMHKSCKQREWAGEGIYFFIDKYSSEGNAKKNSYKWARYIRKIPPKEVAIIYAEIEIDNNLILDLVDPKHQEVYHKFREKFCEIESRKLKKLGMQLPVIYQNKITLDCKVINEMCKEFNFQAVIKRDFVNFKSLIGGYSYSASAIPNCTIFCLREDKHIKSLSKREV